jgi:hypothetical protein
MIKFFLEVLNSGYTAALGFSLSLHRNGEESRVKNKQFLDRQHCPEYKFEIIA